MDKLYIVSKLLPEDEKVQYYYFNNIDESLEYVNDTIKIHNYGGGRLYSEKIKPDGISYYFKDGKYFIQIEEDS